jgi:predicted dinucleotide-binding enzyme
MECDVLVSADQPEAAERVIALVEDAGMRGWHAGPLANSAAAEALTSVLISLNRRYRAVGSGIRITGIPG